MKRFLIKALVLIMSFLLVLGIYGYFVYRDNREVSITESVNLMGSATLPVLYEKLNETNINEVHGYTTEMDPGYFRRSVLPVGDDGQISLMIDPYSANVISMNFTVSDYENHSQVIASSVSNWDLKDGKILVDLSISGLKTGKEYYMDLLVTTETHPEIHYYFAIQCLSHGIVNDNLPKILDFVQEYSQATLDYNKAVDFVIPYIEPSESNANDNLGKVDITSSLRQLTYQNLEVKQETQTKIYCTQVTEIESEFVLCYQIKADNEDGIEEHYEIKEVYRVAYYNGNIYLVAYDRSMDQVYDPASANQGTKRLNLGILSSRQVQIETSENYSKIAFVNAGDLYVMDTKNNVNTKIFTFDHADGNDARNTFDEHGYEVISLENDGSMDFMVYGYMNRGEHEGQSGAALYHYDAEKMIVEERVFLPSDEPYEVLKESVTSLSYLSDEDMFYLKMEDSVYSVDLGDQSYVEVVGDLDQEEFATSKDGRYLAWVETTDGLDRIRILDLESGTEKNIQGQKNRVLVPLGFVDNDLCYGVAASKNVYPDRYGDETYLFGYVRIVDKNQEVLKTYKKKGYYLTDVKVNKAMVSFSVVQKNSEEETGYQVVSEDQILNNTADATEAVNISTIVTEFKQTQVVINYASNVISSEDTKLTYPKEIQTDGKNKIDIYMEDAQDDYYYVYYGGCIIGVYASQAQARILAEENRGFVVDGMGRTIYQYEEVFG